jgi:hypothetical protein
MGSAYRWAFLPASRWHVQPVAPDTSYARCHRGRVFCGRTFLFSACICTTMVRVSAPGNSETGVEKGHRRARNCTLRVVSALVFEELG